MTVFAGDPIAASDINIATDRRLGTFTGDTDGTLLSFTSENQIDQVPNVPLVAGRRYRVKYVFHLQGTTTENTLLVRIRIGSSAGAQLTYGNAVAAVIGGGRTQTIEADFTAAATGNQTFTTTAIRVLGSTTSQFRGAASQPRSLTVEYAA